MSTVFWLQNELMEIFQLDILLLIFSASNSLDILAVLSVERANLKVSMIWMTTVNTLTYTVLIYFMVYEEHAILTAPKIVLQWLSLRNIFSHAWDRNSDWTLIFFSKTIIIKLFLYRVLGTFCCCCFSVHWLFSCHFYRQTDK